jgi:hypothetical protein
LASVALEATSRAVPASDLRYLIDGPSTTIPHLTDGTITGPL